MGHSERKHALLSASGAGRWLACPPSAKLEEQFPDTESPAAAEGTLAHELAEAKVRNFFFPKEFGKRKLNSTIKKLQADELWNNEMHGYADEYLDYIKDTALSLKSMPSVRIEQRVYFKEYTLADPEDKIEGSGIADCILLYGDTVHVIDFKYGKGVPVNAENNPQLMLYALGAYQAYRMLYPVSRAKLTIVQPRLDSISEWECPAEDLLKFGEYVKERAALAVEGRGDYAPDLDTCRFCRAKAQCRARSEENVRLAFFTDKKPPLISNEEVGEYLKKGEDVAKWLEDLKAYALKECLAGKEVPGWKAVEGRGSRGWTDMDAAFDVLVKAGITPEEMLWEKKPLTLAQVEKLVGKKDFQESVGTYVVKKPGKPALAKEADIRPAITNKVTAAEAFKTE
ncbi:MAG: DUF2800 domain-containing protein [Dorea sp.]|jgi:hypothetical protein|nr:DUF2800 domain-containing protein [Dorea sp.]